MRTLQRNKRLVEYRRVIGTEAIGNTLEEKKIYSAPVKARWNISAAIGEEASAVFGDITNYSRTVALCGKSPVAEGDLVIFDQKSYSVVKIADSLNGVMLALQEVVLDEESNQN